MLETPSGGILEKPSGDMLETPSGGIPEKNSEVVLDTPSEGMLLNCIIVCNN